MLILSNLKAHKVYIQKQNFLQNKKKTYLEYSLCAVLGIKN